MESKLEQLVHGTDEWGDLTNTDQLIPWHDRSALTNRHTALEAWRGQAQPRIDSSIEQWAMRFMGSSSGHFSMDLMKNALSVLLPNGSPKQRLLAEEGADYLDQLKDGRQKET